MSKISLLSALSLTGILAAPPTRHGIHRVTADSRAGRSMTSAKGAVVVAGGSKLTAEQIEWNRQVDERKAAKRAKP